jgi:hypothetical protein
LQHEESVWQKVRQRLENSAPARLKRRHPGRPGRDGDR